jgi:hypothetical protein
MGETLTISTNPCSRGHTDISGFNGNALTMRVSGCAAGRITPEDNTSLINSDVSGYGQGVCIVYGVLFYEEASGIAEIK